MFTAKTLKILAAVTFVEFAVSAAIGPDHDVVWILDDILFFALIISVIALILLSIGVLVKYRTRSRTTQRRAEA
jgi:hypothetical protein